MKDLSTKYLGLQLKNPLIAGSCGLTGDVKTVQTLEDKGVGAVVLKSLFEEEIVREMDANLKKMASIQFTYPETLDIFENEIVEDKITEKYLKLISDCRKKVEIPIIASVNCISADQWTYFPKRLESAGADALELNIFILPSDMNKTAEENEKVYFDIIKEVKKQVKIPVSVKISYYSSDLAAFIKRLSESGIQGVVLFNRFYNPDFDINELKLISSNVLSSPEDISKTLRWIALMSGRIDCDISASTGVHDEKGLIKMLLAGADSVQVVSTLYKNGADQVINMLRGLESWMDYKEYSSISDFKGIMGKQKSDNPGAFERIQFMKYVKGYRPDKSFSDDI